MKTHMKLHSWSIKDWPPEIYPNSPSRARYMVRANKSKLISAGALVRVGRELVIIAEPYMKWMEGRGSTVPGYECPANRK